MGRRPIHEEAMSATERQRRRRERLRAEPWRDQRRAVRAIVQALRDLQAEPAADSGLDPQLIARICERAVVNMGIEDEADRKRAQVTVAKLLDPDEPLPERGHRARRGPRQHRFGDRMRRRHGRHADDADEE